ncbi:hypothetical protein NUU61_009613 [Penicillium alfredii]|uniref:Uncharacterized protein n=1 Tax=Penicillium alfredii TaxID=1506179 RepID=A0A9W9EGI6_9EURO|nr:uncharacterized protein NUU61_009613 [Penicillium alfredii]KAJ5081349.1 hypothetical protein NUU61_009613 [Penicillium alfredii]
MPRVLAYSLAGASMLFTFIVTILNGLSYATFQSLSTYTPTGLAPVGLSAVSCVALIVLSVLLHDDNRAGYCSMQWKMGVFYFTSAYLLIAAGSTAGAMASNTQFNSLSIARSVFWAISVFTQGLYGGYLLMTWSQRRSDPEWPRSYSHELGSSTNLDTVSSPPRAVCDPCGSVGLNPKRSSLRKFPRRSSRYSGGTLCFQNSEEDKYGSIDTSSSTLSPETSPIIDKVSESLEHRDTRPLLRGSGSIRSMPSLRRNQEIKLSLDTLVQPSPTASTLHTNPSQQTHIHPLFRSNSPSPSPTPTPGTMVKASPSAGQTITTKTLTRMRSARSLRDQTMRTPSPLPGLEFDESTGTYLDPTQGVSGILAGHVRRNVSEYEKRHDLNESAEEK